MIEAHSTAAKTGKQIGATSIFIPAYKAVPDVRSIVGPAYFLEARLHLNVTHTDTAT